MKGKCAWCGNSFEKNHGNQKYCSKKCLKYATQEQTRIRVHRWYHKHKHELSEKRRYGLGTGTLSNHRKTDFEMEHNAILKEKARLKIK